MDKVQGRGILLDKITTSRIKLLVLVLCVVLVGYLFFTNEISLTRPIVGEENVNTGGIVVQVARQVSPSVVGITNLQNSGGMFSQNSSESTGSGVIIDSRGYIVTNNHVVQGADKLIVTLVDGNEREATIVGQDPRTDLALIKIKVKNKVSPAAFGDSEKLEVGQQVVAIGNPLGLRFARSVTSGVVSGLNRLITTEEGFMFRLIQTDAAINPGNSGGALVNMNGEVVGINTVKIAVPGFEGMGFSIPSRQVQMITKDLMEHGKVVHPVLGIRILGEIKPNEASYFNLPVHHGVIVSPNSGGSAGKVGIKEYDVITAVNGKKVETALELQELIMKRKAGDTVKISIVRMPGAAGGKAQKFTREIKLQRED